MTRPLISRSRRGAKAIEDDYYERIIRSPSPPPDRSILAYYRNRVPEKMDNLDNPLTRKPTMADEAEFEDDGKLTYVPHWRKGHTVTCTNLSGEPTTFLRGGLSVKTRAGPRVIPNRRCWKFYTTCEPSFNLVHSISFPGKRSKFWYPDLSYRDEYMSEDGPSIPVAPGQSGRYWDWESDKKIGGDSDRRPGWTDATPPPPEQPEPVTEEMERYARVQDFCARYRKANPHLYQKN